jgi:hypothetical protein
MAWRKDSGARRQAQRGRRARGKLCAGLQAGAVFTGTALILRSHAKHGVSKDGQEKWSRKIIYPRSKNLTDNAGTLLIEGRCHEAS